MRTFRTMTSDLEALWDWLQELAPSSDARDGSGRSAVSLACHWLPELDGPPAHGLSRLGPVRANQPQHAPPGRHHEIGNGRSGECCRSRMQISVPGAHQARATLRQEVLAKPIRNTGMEGAGTAVSALSQARPPGGAVSLACHWLPELDGPPAHGLSRLGPVRANQPQHAPPGRHHEIGNGRSGECCRSRMQISVPGAHQARATLRQEVLAKPIRNTGMEGAGTAVSALSQARPPGKVCDPSSRPLSPAGCRGSSWGSPKYTLPVLDASPLKALSRQGSDQRNMISRRFMIAAAPPFATARSRATHFCARKLNRRTRGWRRQAKRVSRRINLFKSLRADRIQTVEAQSDPMSGTL